jgi:hypothetical protein
VQVIDPVAKAIEANIAFDLRASWQARVLSAAGGHMGAVTISVLAHTLDDAMPTLLRIVFPGFTSIAAPFYCSAAKVAKSGHIVADAVTRDGQIVKDAKVFENELQMRDAFRRLADHVKLNDPERIELFKYAQRWVVADRRLDPTLDPQDPDARRLH